MFTYQQPTKIIFGAGQLERLPEEIKKAGKKVLLIGPIMNDNIRPMFTRILDMLQKNEIETVSFFEVESNPSSSTVDKAHCLALDNHIDLVVAVGGGSVLDTGKMVAATMGMLQINWADMFGKYTDFNAFYPPLSSARVPMIAIPTTAGTGSQCTQASVITDSESHMKLTVFHQDNFPDTAIIDSELALTTPPFITSSTAFDAFTHAFESYLRNDSDEFAEMMSIKAMKNVARYLPKVLKDNTIENRLPLSLADTCGGIALSNCGAALPHPLSEIIGSTLTKMSHGQGLALVYPSFLKHTWRKYTEKYAFVCRIFDPSECDKTDEKAASEFSSVMYEFLKQNDLNFSISQFCTEPSEIERIRTLQIWDHLPMESADTIHAIVDEVCNK